MADFIFLAFPGVGTLGMTREQFETALAAGKHIATKAEIAPSADTTVPSADSKLLDAQELEERTGIPKSWWMTQARERRIPFRKIGRRVRFTLDEVLACETFRRHEISAVNEYKR